MFNISYRIYVKCKTFSNLYLKRKKAKASFELRLENNNVIDVFAYDDMADKIYQEVQQNDIINIIGKMHSDMKVECK